MTGGLLAVVPSLRTIVWRDERNAANHAEFLDFAPRSTERQVDRMLRLMPVFPDAPEIIVPARNIWAPQHSLVFADELAFASELQRLGGLEGFQAASSTEDKKDAGTPVAPCGVTPMCGPDVTKQMKDVVNDIVRVYFGWSNEEKKANCDELFRVLPRSSSLTVMPAEYAWDIVELHEDLSWLAFYRPPCATGEGCESTVQIDSGCHYTGSANYLLFGVACRCCNASEETMLSAIKLHKGPLLGRSQPALDYQGSLAWALAGRRGWPFGTVTTPFGDRNDCNAECPISYGPRPQPNVKFKRKTGQPFGFHWGSYHS